MGGSMTKVLPGLYVGALDNTKNEEELMANGISHILVVQNDKYEIEKSPGRHYLQVVISERDSRALTRCLPETDDFIHAARIQSDNVLVCSDSGMSASVAVVAAYLMSVYRLDSRSALGVVQGLRHAANPVASLQDQLERFEGSGEPDDGTQDSSVAHQTSTQPGCDQELTVQTERARLIDKFGVWPWFDEDMQAIHAALKSYKTLTDSGFYVYDPDDAPPPVEESIDDQGDPARVKLQRSSPSGPRVCMPNSAADPSVGSAQNAQDRSTAGDSTTTHWDDGVFGADPMFDEPSGTQATEDSPGSAESAEHGDHSRVIIPVAVTAVGVRGVSHSEAVDQGLEADEIGFELDEDAENNDGEDDDNIPGAMFMPISSGARHGVAASYHHAGSVSRRPERSQLGRSLASAAQYHTNVGSFAQNSYHPSVTFPAAYPTNARDPRLSTTAPFRRTFW